MIKRVVLVACVVGSLTGCATAALKHQAALDHGCPEDRIIVGRSPGDSGLPTEVDVCGQIRRYRIVSWNDSGMPTWLDVTNLTPSPGNPAAR